MAAGSTNVVVKFLADITDISKGVDKIGGHLDGVTKWAKRAGLAIGGAFAVDQVKEWISAASELQDAVSASEQIFGAAANTVGKFADNAATAFGMSKQEAIDAANTFATFGKGAGLAGDDLAGFATNLTGLAGDLASFRGTTPEQAIQAIGAALRGETEPIRAYGVLLDDATLRQRALKMGLISTTKDALTPQQKVLAAQQEIFAQTSDAQGDFQRTSDSAANQQKILSAELANTQAALGTALLPVLQMILPVLTIFAEFIKENSTWLVPLTAAVLGAAAAIWIFNAALSANPIMLVVIAIAALVAAVILLWKNWDTIWSAIVGAVQWATDFIVGHWQMIIGIIFPFIGALMLLWNNWDSIWQKITGVIRWAADFIIGVFNSVIGFFRGIPGAIASALSSVGNIIVAPFQWAWNTITNIVNGIINTIASLPGRAADIFRNLVSGIAGIWNNTVGALSFSIPDWVPGIGGKGFDVPDIRLAKGGIVTRPTMALLGERGPEAVIPLNRAAGTGGTNITVNVTTTGLGADSPQIQRDVVAVLRGYAVRNGTITGVPITG